MKEFEIFFNATNKSDFELFLNVAKPFIKLMLLLHKQV